MQQQPYTVWPLTVEYVCAQGDSQGSPETPTAAAEKAIAMLT